MVDAQQNVGCVPDVAQRERFVDGAGRLVGSRPALDLLVAVVVVRYRPLEYRGVRGHAANAFLGEGSELARTQESAVDEVEPRALSQPVKVPQRVVRCGACRRVRHWSSLPARPLPVPDLG